MEDFGSAFTGQTVDPAEANQRWDSWLVNPNNRSALLQMGLQMMQPVGIGQTAGGHIAQSIGAGGEALARGENMDIRAATADAKIQAADERLRIAQQTADANTLRSTSAATREANRKVGGLTDLFRARALREDQRNHDKDLMKEAERIKEEADGYLADPNSDIVKKYKGRSALEIRDELRKARPFKADPSLTAPLGEDDEDPSTALPPPAPGAKLAPDGNYYMPDPKRPGKWIKVTQ